MELAPLVSDGRMCMADAYAEVIRHAGAVPAPDTVASLVRRDRELLIETTHLYDDTIPLLETLRRQGFASALISNCAENTRPLLAALGLIDLVDAVVLSCEVGYEKPAPQIYRVALETLGFSSEEAVFVDDQVSYCAGAAAVGMATVRIDRATPAPATPGVIRSLDELRHRLVRTAD